MLSTLLRCGESTVSSSPGFSPKAWAKKQCLGQRDPNDLLTSRGEHAQHTTASSSALHTCLLPCPSSACTEHCVRVPPALSFLRLHRALCSSPLCLWTPALKAHYPPLGGALCAVIALTPLHVLKFYILSLMWVKCDLMLGTVTPPSFLKLGSISTHQLSDSILHDVH